jgi:FMN phosphatase YigB (HAD superfamily)
MKDNTKAILFDMDGTLLPMDLEIFIREYFSSLVGYLVPLGYEKDEIVDGVWKGTGAMMKNDGTKMNEELFWQVLAARCGERVFSDRGSFDRFYETEFDKARSCCGFDEWAKSAVEAAKDTGRKLVLASNPVFPRSAQIKRAEWAGVDARLFDHITSYENCRYCKPDPGYYKDIADSIGVECGECLMIGNDVGEDMCAAELGMDVFLVTPCMINRDGSDISGIRKGTLKDLIGYL